MAALEKLMAPFPPEAVDRSRGSQTGKGYDTTGYGYQWVANRLNDVFGIAGWSTEEEILSVVEGTTAKGRPVFEIVCRIRIDFTDPDTGTKGSRTCFGWHKASFLGDAYKGAFTNALKKTAGLIGAGWQAYADEIDDDNQPIPESDGRGERREPPRMNSRQIQEEARQPDQKSHKRVVWERIQTAIKTLGPGEAATVLGCPPAGVPDWKPANEHEAAVKMAALETAVAKRGSAPKENAA